MRRPIASRETGWARQIAKALATRGVSPNAISASSVLFAALATLCLVMVPRVDTVAAQVALYCGAALCVQLRLLCNLFDGMLAVEWGKASALGPIWNDFPDRPADVCILVGCAYSAGPAWMSYVGLGAAGLALLTAYTRVLRAAIGGGEHFTGPMAKQQRMAVVTIASLLGALEAVLHWPHQVVAFALVVIVLGCILTIIRRLKLIAEVLEEKAKPQ